MQVRLNPYLSFKNTTREAMEFYKTVFGGTLTMSAFKDMPGSADMGSEGDLIMHAMLEGENGVAFMASDTPSAMPHEPGASISMSLSGEGEEALRGYWEKLSAGGTVTVPLDKAPWGDTFGMLTDKFGIRWMVNILGKKA